MEELALRRVEAQSGRPAARRSWNAPATRRMLAGRQRSGSGIAPGQLERTGERGVGSRRARRDHRRISGSRGAGVRRRSARRARARVAADAAQRQRPGVSDRVPGRNGRRSVPAQPLARFESRHGRGAAPVLRRHDARGEAAVSELGALSPALRRRPAGSLHPVAIPERSSDGAGRRSWPVRGNARRKWTLRRAARGSRNAKRNLYTGKTYNSVDNIQQFFAERGKARRCVRSGPADAKAASQPPAPDPLCRRRRRGLRPADAASAPAP